MRLQEIALSYIKSIKHQDETYLHAEAYFVVISQKIIMVHKTRLIGFDSSDLLIICSHLFNYGLSLMILKKAMNYFNFNGSLAELRLVFNFWCCHPHYLLDQYLTANAQIFELYKNNIII